MSITVLSYHDQALVDQIHTQAAARAEAERAAAKASSLAKQEDFSTVLGQAAQTYQAPEAVSPTVCPEDLNSIFEEAGAAFGVSVNLLKSIARAESGFDPTAVSHAGAVGIMQLMPQTAASLGVTNSYDPRENIMGGAKLISQLLEKYNGNTTLALAAYNAGSGNVEKYGGIPPFTETIHYINKVHAYLNAGDSTDISQTVSDALSSRNLSKEALDLLAELVELLKADENTTADTDSKEAAAEPAPQITVTVMDGEMMPMPSGSSTL